MNTHRNAFISLFFIITLSSLSACNPTPSPDTQSLIQSTTESTIVSNPNTQKTIALVMKTLTNPFFVEMEKGARKAEKELGIQLIVKTAAQETSIEQQIQIVDDLISTKVDAIVIAPGDSVELISVLKKAQDSGIIVINIDNKLDAAQSEKLGLKNVPFISVDNEMGGYLSVKTISQNISAPTDAVILEGIRTAKNAEDRKNGALRAFKENANIRVVAAESAEWKIDKGYEITTRLFKSHPEIKLIFAANDMMGLGAIQYLEEKNVTDVQVASFDALDEAKKAIREGKMVVTIDQQAAEQGYLGVKYAMNALKGESLPITTLVDVLVVTKNTLKP